MSTHAGATTRLQSLSDYVEREDSQDLLDLSRSSHVESPDCVHTAHKKSPRVAALGLIVHQIVLAKKRFDGFHGYEHFALIKSDKSIRLIPGCDIFIQRI